MRNLRRVGPQEARAEVWFALWRLLWRPDAVYDAAYAAVPHVLAIAQGREFGEREKTLSHAWDIASDALRP